MTMEEQLTALVVDDEPHAREGLIAMLADFAGLVVLRDCSNGLEAVKAVNELRPQLLFLDIQMPKLDGFDVLELLGPDAPMVIFVTAYDEHAIRAFESNAVDYLLKPVDPGRLRAAVGRALTRIRTSEPDPASRLREAGMQEDSLLPRLLVRDGSDVHVLSVQDVICIESADDYVAIHTAEATHIKLDSLSRLESRLDPRLFCRVHRSFLLNIQYLARIESETRDSRTAVLSTGRELPISRSGYRKLQALL